MFVYIGLQFFVFISLFCFFAIKSVRFSFAAKTSLTSYVSLCSRVRRKLPQAVEVRRTQRVPGRGSARGGSAEKAGASGRGRLRGARPRGVARYLFTGIVKKVL